MQTNEFVFEPSNPISDAFIWCPAREICIDGGIGNSKDLWLETPIPTPNGWTTMGELHVGDLVFGDDGRTAEVLFCSPIRYPRSYRVVFSDDSSIVASDTHLWQTHNYRERIALARNPNSVLALGRVRTTQEIADSLLTADKGKQLNHAVSVASPLELPDKDFLIDPYCLGIWLGDGFSAGSRFCGTDEGIAEELRGLGYSVK